MFNVACELSQPMGKTEFQAPLKIEQTLSHRQKQLNLTPLVVIGVLWVVLTVA